MTPTVCTCYSNTMGEIVHRGCHSNIVTFSPTWRSGLKNSNYTFRLADWGPMLDCGLWCLTSGRSFVLLDEGCWISWSPCLICNYTLPYFTWSSILESRYLWILNTLYLSLFFPSLAVRRLLLRRDEVLRTLSEGPVGLYPSLPVPACCGRRVVQLIDLKWKNQVVVFGFLGLRYVGAFLEFLLVLFISNYW